MGNKIIKEEYFSSYLEDMEEIIKEIKEQIKGLEYSLEMIKEQYKRNYREGTLRAIDTMLVRLGVSASKFRSYIDERQTDYAALRHYVELNSVCLQYRKLYKKEIQKIYRETAKNDARAFVRNEMKKQKSEEEKSKKEDK